MFDNLFYKLRLLVTLIVVPTLLVGCVIKANITAKPLMIIDNKIPLNVVLVIPENIRQHECTCFSSSLPFVFYINYNCGTAFYDTCRESMKKVFVEVQTVRNISEAVEPWDRVLWLEVDDFQIAGFLTKPRVWINLKYKLTDKNNKTVFSSNIFLETKDELGIGHYELTSEFIEQVMLKMVEEIMDAHNKGQL